MQKSGSTIQRPIGDPRSVSYAILLGVWAMVAVYAVLHDQYIVRIAPEHFTEYHRPIPGFATPGSLAFVHSFGASISTGLALGLACVLIGRFGKAPRVPVGRILTGVALTIICTELLSAALGFYVWRSGKTPFPVFLYPDESLSMLVTQTIQLSSFPAT